MKKYFEYFIRDYIDIKIDVLDHVLHYIIFRYIKSP